MARNGASLDDKLRWMREKHSAVDAVPVPCAVSTERHFSPAEIGEMWNLSQDAVRKIFQREPGVLVLGDQGQRGKRRYTTLRVPESVLYRVHQRLSKV